MAKIISIITVVTLLAIGFWVTAEPWVDSPTKFADWHVWILPLVIMTLLAASNAVAYAILPRKRLKLLVALLVGLAYLAVYGVDVDGINYYSIIAFFLLLVFHVFAIRAIQLESQERLKIHPWLIMRRGIAEIMLPLYLCLSFAYFASPVIQVKAREHQIISPSLKQAVSAVFDKFLEGDRLPVSDEQRQAAKSYALERTYDVVARLADPYRPYFPPALAFGLFLILWGLGFVLQPLTLGVGITLFYLLRAARVVVVAERMVPVETIVLQNGKIKMENDNAKS